MPTASMLILSIPEGATLHAGKRNILSLELTCAETAFYDRNARTSYDPDRSQDKDRYILLGMSESFKLIVVCHVYRQDDESIRIISARRATKTEQKEYKGYLT
jgi:uncharacterized protein